MDLKTAINYVTQYRRNGRSCYVHAANRGAAVLQTNRGAVESCRSGLCDSCELPREYFCRRRGIIALLPSHSIGLHEGCTHCDQYKPVTTPSA